MERSRKLAYIMPIDIRSRYAHVVNIMHMCQAFKRSGQDVTLIVPGHAGSVDLKMIFDQYGILNDFAIKFVPIPAVKVGRVDAGGRLFGIWTALYILRDRIDLCYTRLPSIAHISGHLGITSVLEMHMPPTSILDAWAFAQIVGQIKKGGRTRYKVMAISNRLAEILNNRFDLPISDVFVCHDAVDLGPYNAVASDGNDLKRQLGVVKEGTLLFTYSGSLYEGRGVEMIVELARRFPQNYFLVVGGDELRIKSCRREFDWVKNLCFYGYVPHKDVAHILKGSDVLLMPHARRVTVDGTGDISEYTSPMKMFEYLAAAKPIIASNLPSILEILKHGENALIAEPEDISSWSACVSALLGNAGLRRKLSMAARVTAENNTWDKRATRIMDFIVS